MKTPWWWHVWCGETWWRTRNMWRFHLVHVPQRAWVRVCLYPLPFCINTRYNSAQACVYPHNMSQATWYLRFSSRYQDNGYWTMKLCIMADACRRFGGIFCLQLKGSMFLSRMSIPLLIQRRHSQEDCIKRFYDFRTQTDNDNVWDSTIAWNGSRSWWNHSQHYRKPTRNSFHANQACFDNTSRSAKTSQLVASVYKIPSFITTRKHVTTSHVEEEAPCNQKKCDSARQVADRKSRHN
jgi:hypothetical protein